MREWIRFVAFAFFTIFSISTSAQEYPSRPITAIVPFSAGSASDVIEPLASSPEEFGRYISAEVVKWREIITKGGITLE